MNATAVISAEIQVSDIPIFEALFKRMKAKKIIIKSKKDRWMPGKSRISTIHIHWM